MFVRVRDFGTERAASFPANSLGGEQFTEVKAICEILNEMAASQSSGVGSAQQATASRTNAREALRETLHAITRTARAMALDTPGLENKFRLPRSGSDQALLSTARAFIADAAPLKAEFVRHELPAAFIEEMGAEIAELERAIGGQNTGRGTHIIATASIDSTVERGMAAVTKLDAIVRNKFRDDPATLAAWESARHTERMTRAARRSNHDAAGEKPSSVVEKS